ncbi:3-keto-5-aminohexanoate cleavage protein [Phycicoccus sp. CSK15P-2]|uniref:3-keto-5-aminohexanoate cleavage protein n=1 Tax=Phycicoccus sp. CSK15P-2 TaxID=2807627 RepID=UPI00194E031F|nr:3-keto-5-aminohexanoate cleavage protein [Phycicoccus sp. CSK15P-2]MBM6404056.1 3-keto-5-aminohexanoate cleavage protein [Phycicoccus sp. CSK15P-2]
MLQVTPNGPFGRERHPALPVLLHEVLHDLGECVRAGADGVHLHARDAAGAESLDPTVVAQTCAAVREVGRECGVDLEVGLTTGAWIVPDVTQRVAMVREWEGVDCATVNVGEPGFETVMATLVDAGIGVDAGVWAPAEVDALVASGLLPHLTRVSVELSPGEPYRLTGDPRQVAADVWQRLDAAGVACARLTHGDGTFTWPLVREAFALGHHTRVGFEDSVQLPDGRIATGNADLVRAAVDLRAAA